MTTSWEFPNVEAKILPADIQLIFPLKNSLDWTIANRLTGSLVGLALGDTLGASVEFRPREYLLEYPIIDLTSGGTWGLQLGQWTDDTSMALCLAASLINEKGFSPYDQLVRYKWWYERGYLSSTGQCFDIGNATRSSIEEFIYRQKKLNKMTKKKYKSTIDRIPSDVIEETNFDVNCSGPGVAGNGALMRLAPVPLFFYRNPIKAVEFSGQSARLTHGGDVGIDACRYYAALIVAALHGATKEDLLDNQFYEHHKEWFDSKPLHREIRSIAAGSYKRPKGYDDGIRGKGYVVNSLEAALWAFWSGENFADCILKAVNLGDDSDTTAAICGQLAGAFYGYNTFPQQWKEKLYAHDLIVCTAQWLQLLGSAPIEKCLLQKENSYRIPSVSLSTSHLSRITIGEDEDPHVIVKEKAKNYSVYKRSQSSIKRSKRKSLVSRCFGYFQSPKTSQS